MMNELKKYSIYFIRYILAIIVFVSCFCFNNYDVKAASKATTLKELKQELAQLEANKNANDKKKQLTKAEINAKNKAINDSYSEIETAESNIAAAKKEIEKTEVKIKELNEQTEQVMTFYQLMSGDNAYLEFVSDSSSMTELIMRLDAVEQLVSYNKDKLSEMEDLIESNEQKQVDLKKYEADLQKKITSYENKITELDSSLLALEDISIDINGEIKIQKDLIQMYVNAGCKDNDNLATCINYGANNGWLKPFSKGMITSLFGRRNVAGQSSNHSGIDIGVAEGTTVYSVTNGKVISVLTRQSCGGNQVFVQSMVNGKKYTILYAHLYSISVSSGQEVNTNTVIGKSGGYSTSTYHGGYDRCTTGAHLHLSVSEGYYTEYPAGSAYSLFVAHLINPPGYPGKGGWFYSRTQWFG